LILSAVYRDLKQSMRLRRFFFEQVLRFERKRL